MNAIERRRQFLRNVYTHVGGDTQQVVSNVTEIAKDCVANVEEACDFIKYFDERGYLEVIQAFGGRVLGVRLTPYAVDHIEHTWHWPTEEVAIARSFRRLYHKESQSVMVR